MMRLYLRWRIAFVALAVALSPRLSIAEDRIESWYGYFAISPLVATRYPAEADPFFRNVPFVGFPFLRTRVAYGVSWPLSERALFGIMLSGNVEEGADGKAIGSSLYGLSLQYFPDRIGRNLYTRVDLGPTRFKSGGAPSQWGVGTVLGIGYAFPVSDETRLTICPIYSTGRVESKSYGVWGLEFGVLW